MFINFAIWFTVTVPYLLMMNVTFAIDFSLITDLCLVFSTESLLDLKGFMYR